jgi:plasmid stabilization system protein ParE
MLTVEFTPQAEADLLEIEDYLISQEGPTDRVLDFALSLFQNTLAIGESALQHPIYTVKTDSKEIRRKVLHRNYSAFYLIENGQISILRIWHNARNPSDLAL